jgi:hypothetical protein
LSNKKQNAKQCRMLCLPINIKKKFSLPHIQHLPLHIFTHLHIGKQLQASFYKNMIYLSSSLYQGWKISTIMSEKMILYMYWWDRGKRIVYLSKILSLEVESYQGSFPPWQLKRWNGMWDCGKEDSAPFCLIPKHAAIITKVPFWRTVLRNERLRWK